MDDKYNSLTINNLSLVSPDLDNKIIPLDLILTDIIKHIYIYKTFNPTLYSDLAETTIAIETKDYPQKKCWRLHYSCLTIVHSRILNKFVMTYLDIYSGYELASREVPEQYNQNNLGVYAANSKESKDLFNTTWNNSTFIAIPSISFTIKYGNRHYLKNNNSFGYYVSFKFNNNNYVTQNGVNRLLNSLGNVINEFSMSSHSYETQKYAPVTGSYILHWGLSLTAKFDLHQ